jgi:hypothetical protein
VGSSFHLSTPCEKGFIIKIKVIMPTKIIIEKELLYNLYINQNKSSEEISKTLKVSKSVIKTNLKNFGITKDRSQTLLKMQETCLAKYGVKSYRQTKECSDRIKLTCISKYGEEHYSKTPEYQQKLQRTNLERYGVKNYTNKEKMKETLLSKYGTDNYSKLPECREKVKSTCLAKFGVEYYSQT